MVPRSKKRFFWLNVYRNMPWISRALMEKHAYTVQHTHTQLMICMCCNTYLLCKSLEHRLLKLNLPQQIYSKTQYSVCLCVHVRLITHNCIYIGVTRECVCGMYCTSMFFYSCSTDLEHVQKYTHTHNDTHCTVCIDMVDLMFSDVF